MDVTTSEASPKIGALYIAIKKRTLEAMRKGLHPDDALQGVANALGAMIGECIKSGKPEDAERIAEKYTSIVVASAKLAVTGMHRLGAKGSPQ